MPSTLPLFPLNTVLVPGLVMPLHIFEPRYRHMVTTLLALADEDDREFGIIAVRPGHDLTVDAMAALYPVGCATVIRQYEVLDDGRYDIVTTGSRRFRVLSVDTSLSLLSAQVEFLDDDELAHNDRAALRAARAFRTYRAVLGDQVVDSTEPDEDDGIPDDPTVLSYLITAAMVLTVEERQSLLAASTTAERLVLAHELLHRESGVISALSALPALEPLGPPPSAN